MTSGRRSLLVKCSLLLSLAALLTGLTVVGGVIQWQFLAPWPANFDGNGIPLPKSPYFYKDPVYNHPQFINFVTSQLPNWTDQSNNTALFDPANARYFVVDTKNNPAATVELSFVHEEAGYRNSLGYFLFDADNPPTSKTDPRILVEKVVFPNGSYFNSGGSPYGLRSGDSVTLDLTLPAGKTLLNGKLGIGFFLVSDGFDALTGVRTNASLDWIFYSIPALNTEVGASARGIGYNEHFVLLKYQAANPSDPANGAIALAMEDFNRTPGLGSDNDFNDIVYSVTVTPSTALANGTAGYKAVYTPTPPIVDSDGDGVPDSLDEFPVDPQRATSTWYPSQTGWNILAFEDTWPSSGDYDMNDLVVKYRNRQILHANGQVKEVEIQYQLVAMGARDHNGFALELTGIPLATALEYATLKVNGGAASAISPTASVLGKANTSLVFRIFNDAYAAFGLGSTADQRVNTIRNGGVTKSPVTYQLNVAFTTPLPGSQFTYAPLYNPFIFKGNSVATEIHLPGYAPTTSADTSKFGTVSDNSNAAAKRYYVTAMGYPWALDIPSGWQWPTEGTDIVTAYSSFKAWAESGGTSQTTWYLSGTAAYIYP